MLKFSTEVALPFLTGVWVFALSFLSAVVTYFNRICLGEDIKFPWITFARDILYCQMAGLITYLLAFEAGFDGIVTAALVSAGSHMGARLVAAIEEFVMRSIHLCSQENGKK